jgi:hypothetical protein
MSSLFLLTIDVSSQNFTTCIPFPPPSSTWDGSKRPVNTSGGFRQHVGTTSTGLGKRQHLEPGAPRLGRRSPRVADSMLEYWNPSYHRLT